MEWERHKASWPNAARSQFVASGPHRWHVQQAGAGAGAPIVLLHGAGGSTHSWGPVFEALSATHHVTALDLPGQGFTKLGARDRCGLAAMAEDIERLLRDLDVEPEVLVGHSAGAAIAVTLATRAGGTDQPRVVSINGAYESFGGLAGVVFPAIARALSRSPGTGQLFARLSGGEAGVRRLIASTGSRVSPQTAAFYKALVSDPDHVNATLAMMAQWSLAEMPQTLARLAAPALFLVAMGDRTVRPAASRDAASRAPQGRLETVAGRGHLLQEEAPELVREKIRDFLAATD